jgi:group I intron endonuclease
MRLIYQIKCLANDRAYVGQTKDLKRRIREYRYEHTCKNNYLFYADMRKYGFNNFEISIVKKYNKEIIHKEEKYWIKKLNSLAPNGYNISIGGNSWAWKDPAATAKKISDTRKFRKIKNSDFQRQTISRMMSGANNPKAKINENDVRQIRKEYESGNGSLEKIGKKFNLTKSTVSKIVLKKTWANIN